MAPSRAPSGSRSSWVRRPAAFQRWTSVAHRLPARSGRNAASRPTPLPHLGPGRLRAGAAANTSSWRSANSRRRSHLLRHAGRREQSVRLGRCERAHHQPRRAVVGNVRSGSHDGTAGHRSREGVRGDSTAPRPRAPPSRSTHPTGRWSGLGQDPTHRSSTPRPVRNRAEPHGRSPAPGRPPTRRWPARAGPAPTAAARCGPARTRRPGDGPDPRNGEAARRSPPVAEEPGGAPGPAATTAARPSRRAKPWSTGAMATESPNVPATAVREPTTTRVASTRRRHGHRHRRQRNSAIVSLGRRPARPERPGAGATRTRGEGHRGDGSGRDAPAGAGTRCGPDRAPEPSAGRGWPSGIDPGAASRGAGGSGATTAGPPRGGNPGFVLGQRAAGQLEPALEQDRLGPRATADPQGARRESGPAVGGSARAPGRSRRASLTALLTAGLSWGATDRRAGISFDRGPPARDRHQSVARAASPYRRWTGRSDLAAVLLERGISPA